MTQSQIKWAAEHDWFVKANGDEVVVSETMHNHDKNTQYDIETSFTSFTELKNWAGY